MCTLTMEAPTDAYRRCQGELVEAGLLISSGLCDITATCQQLDDDCWSIQLQSDVLLQGVRLSVNGYQPDDNYFVLAPNRLKTVLFRRVEAGARKFRGEVEALNLDGVKSFTPLLS